jgi:DNA-binding LacI/PurR family transcriptional regulator
MNIAKRYNIKQVANIAGVSTQTISRVINDRSDVSIETREHIQRIIKKLNYHPSALARSLIRQRSFTLGVVTAGLSFSGPSRTLNGITSKADELGYTILLKELPRSDGSLIEPLLKTLVSWPVDGIIWAVPEVGNNHTWVDKGLATIKTPIVFLNMGSRPGLSIINDDNYHGAKTATTHLLEQGYRRIGHLSGPLDSWESRQRKAGWEQALAEAGIAALESHSAAGDWTSSSAAAALHRLQNQYPGMEALFVANDQMALGVIKSLTEQGVSIPEQMGVVGFDGLAEAAYYWPPLTTVAQDHCLLGCTAVEEIVSAIAHLHTEGALPAPRTILLQSELLVRKSSAR